MKRLILSSIIFLAMPKSFLRVAMRPGAIDPRYEARYAMPLGCR